MPLRRKIVMITGASAGIGKACAETFAAANAKLILVARRREMLKVMAEDLLKNYGTETINIECDVRQRKSLEYALGALPKDWRAIDVLINNAGLARGIEKIQDGEIDNWEEMIDTNIKGLLYVSRTVLPWMVERGEGLVINIGSIAGREVYPGGNVYCASKHAVKALSKAMTIDLNGTGVRVTNIDPGLTETEFSQVRFSGDTEKAKDVYKGYAPLYGSDIAEIALFCATRPEHVVIQDILVTPTAQANTSILDRHK